MADRRSKLADYRRKAGLCASRIGDAATQAEALDLAIGAAENLMKALSVASYDEKAELKSECKRALDVADRIKKTGEWHPPAINESDFGATGAPSQGGGPRANVESTAPGLSFPSSTTPSPSTDQNSSHYTEPQGPRQLQPPPTDTLGSPGGNPVDDVEKSTVQPPTAPPNRVRRLKEPVSTRNRTIQENIILLKASLVNGFKFPPWDKDPSPADFAFAEGTDKFQDARELSLSTEQLQFFGGWVHAEDALPPPSLVFNEVKRSGAQMHSTQPLDLVQDAATDCSVVASMCAAIARAQRGHAKILSNKIFPYDQHGPILSENGKYIVRLNFNGCWRKVIIDDRLPVSRTHRLIHVIDRNNLALLWPALLEKAYLKVRRGYDFPGSNSCSDLWIMTGWIPEEVYLQEAEIVPDQLWKRIFRAFQYGDVLVTLGTGKLSPSQERELGLESQHSYVVLDMKETDDSRQLLVKNPWLAGKGWRSALTREASASDEPVSVSNSTHPRPSGRESTTFWMELNQVIRDYERLYLNWNPGLFAHRQDIHFPWTIDDNMDASTCIIKHPQFSFKAGGSDLVFMVLSRHFQNAPAGIENSSDAFQDGSSISNTPSAPPGEVNKGYMSMYVCRSNGEHTFIKNTYEECTPYVSTPQCLLNWTPSANEPYTVVIDQEDLPASTYFFTLSAFSNTPISLEPARQKYPVQKTEAGAWTKQTAGGDTQSPRYYQNPQYALAIRERSSVAILLTSRDPHNPLNVKLAIGQGKRMYKLQSRDVLADSGNYQSGCAFAEVIDLQPGLYTIICSLFEADKTGEFNLRVDSTADFSLKAIPRDGAGLLCTKLAQACFGPKMQRIAAPLFPQRNANFTIVSRFERATSLRSRERLSLSARSPLRVMVELGRGPERKMLAASEGGEYSTTAVVRLESFHLEPSVLQYGDIWLVLDRLSGPGGSVEEWYDVEVFTDMPDAFQIGGWREWDD